MYVCKHKMFSFHQRRASRKMQMLIVVNYLCKLKDNIGGRECTYTITKCFRRRRRRRGLETNIVRISYIHIYNLLRITAPILIP